MGSTSNKKNIPSLAMALCEHGVWKIMLPYYISFVWDVKSLPIIYCSLCTINSTVCWVPLFLLFVSSSSAVLLATRAWVESHDCFSASSSCVKSNGLVPHGALAPLFFHDSCVVTVQQVCLARVANSSLASGLNRRYSSGLTQEGSGATSRSTAFAASGPAAGIWRSEENDSKATGRKRRQSEKINQATCRVRAPSSWETGSALLVRQ